MGEDDGARVSRVKLYEARGETSVYIDAEIDEKGHVVISGQDVGKAPEEFWGDSDYEYWVTVKREVKDKLLRALIEAEFGAEQMSWLEVLKVARPLFRTVFGDLAIDQEAYRRFLDEKEILVEDEREIGGEGQNDALILALIERRFGGKANADVLFREFCKANRVPSEFYSWV